MSPDLTRPFENPGAAQQRFLSLFLRSEREIFRYDAVLVPNLADVEDIMQRVRQAQPGWTIGTRKGSPRKVPS